MNGILLALTVDVIVILLSLIGLRNRLDKIIELLEDKTD